MGVFGEWLGVLLAVTCALVGLSFLRDLRTQRARIASSVAHAVMALGMAAMFAPAANPLAMPVWASTFALVGALSAIVAIRERSFRGDVGHHIVGAVAMLFMLTMHRGGGADPAAVADNGHGAHPVGAIGDPAGVAVGVVGLVMAGWFLADIARHAGESRPGTASAAPHVRGSVPHLVLSAAMAVMLVGMA